MCSQEHPVGSDFTIGMLINKIREKDVRRLRMLFVIEDGLQTTFYLYLLQGGKKKLLRFSPNLQLPDGESLAQKYMQLSITDFLRLLHGMTRVEVKDYIIGTKEKIIDFLLKDRTSMTIENPQAFVYGAGKTTFSKGEITVDKKGLSEFMTYPSDESNPQGIFERQEHMLRLIRNELLREKRLTAIPRKFSRLKKSIETNVGLSDMLKFFSAYRERGNEQAQRLTIPEYQENADTVDSSIWLQQIKQFLSN